MSGNAPRCWLFSTGEIEYPDREKDVFSIEDNVYMKLPRTSFQTGKGDYAYQGQRMNFGNWVTRCEPFYVGDILLDSIRGAAKSAFERKWSKRGNIRKSIQGIFSGDFTQEQLLEVEKTLSDLIESLKNDVAQARARYNRANAFPANGGYASSYDDDYVKYTGKNEEYQLAVVRTVHCYVLALQEQRSLPLPQLFAEAAMQRSLAEGSLSTPEQHQMHGKLFGECISRLEERGGVISENPPKTAVITIEIDYSGKADKEILVALRNKIRSWLSRSDIDMPYGGKPGDGEYRFDISVRDR
jgi:hypothetical protein